MTTNSVNQTTEGDGNRYRPLLAAVRGLVRCDAAALLQLDGQVLRPIAVDG